MPKHKPIYPSDEALAELKRTASALLKCAKNLEGAANGVNFNVQGDSHPGDIEDSIGRVTSHMAKAAEALAELKAAFEEAKRSAKPV